MCANRAPADIPDSGICPSTRPSPHPRLEWQTQVHIISTPWVTNEPAAKKALATKVFYDNTAAGVYVFNPNSGLTAAAAAHNMDAATQGQKWLELWTGVLKRTQTTGGTCFVIAKGSGEHDHQLEGSAQQGEVNVAEMSGVEIEYVYYA